jgi:hypothetical protein
LRDLSSRSARLTPRSLRPFSGNVEAGDRELADEPRPPGCRKLSGFDDVYRLASGSIV